ncbi:hypothetical protein K2X30_09690 [bacterium]|jgi:protein ImuB|nr:hypothetical protein [bacterium]
MVAFTTPKRVICVLFPNQPPQFQEFAEACLRLTPKIAVRPGNRGGGFSAVFLEFQGRATLSPDFARKKIAFVQALARRMKVGAPAACTEGAHAMEALSLARFGEHTGHASVSKLPIDALLDYITPFEYEEEISKKFRDQIPVFKMLGVSKIQDFVRLPTSLLASRFGEEVVLASQRLSAWVFPETLPVWPYFHIQEQVAEKEDFYFEPLENLDSLLFILKHLSNRVMARLRGRGLKAAELELVLELEGNSQIGRPIRNWKIQLPIAQGSYLGLLTVLRERLSYDLGYQPLEAAVRSAEIRILETAPGHGMQRNFFSRKEEEAEAWDALVGRLLQKLGKKNAYRAQPVDRHLPEKAWKPVAPEAPAALVAASPGLRPLLERPLRLLRKPEPMQRLGDYLISQLSKKRWKVSNWQGPERITGEWWWKNFKRDYYQVTTDAGEKLWVFSVPEQPLYQLHGYFD